MTPERYKRLQGLLESALELAPEQRAAFLDEACDGDDALRQQVESLLASTPSAESFLETPVAQIAAQLVNEDQRKLPSGQLLGSYRLISQLGAGGMGEVHLAEDTRLKRKVALKLLRSYFTKDEERLRRFEQEAVAVSALNHPNILTIHEVDQVGALHFIVTEFIDGNTLRTVMMRGPLDLAELLDVGVQIASALTAAHESGVVHRDIKPENIMVRRDGYVKVLDFGIAKLVEKKSTEETDLDAPTKVRTNPGLVLGTVSYMSPEQARGDDVDARADVWSLGVVLYEMAAGHVPFQGATVSHVLVSIQDHPPPAIGQPVNEFTVEFERIVRKALMKDRADRYQLAGDLLSDLKSLQQELSFKGKQGPVGESGVSAHPADRGQDVPNNLPSQLTSLIGRSAETFQVCQQLRNGDIRLLTLTGPGGTGKTRLSLEVARTVLKQFPGGVFFVALAAIRDPSLVASTIAQTLGVKEAAGSSLVDRLKEFLCEKQMLLTIDNFEQVVAAGSVIRELLEATRHLKILATSREALRITGEHEFAVPALSVPAENRALPLDVLSRYPAVELFVARASAVKHDFTLNEANAPAIANICARLDGLPLAIELAAARVKILPPQALSARLDSRLRLLMGGARDLPSRQQTMRGAIAWSHELLDEDEKKLFRRLAVFAGGGLLEAIESICNGPGDLNSDALDTVGSLVDKSLLKQRETGNAEPRFMMLETITEFGLEQLAGSGEEEEIRRHHAHYFLGLAGRLEQDMLGNQQEQVLDQFEFEHANFRAALRWAEKHEEVEIGLKLATALWRFWETRGYLDEGRERLDKLLSLPASDSTSKVRLNALYAAGVLADAQCDYAAARSLFAEKLELHRQLGDDWGIANSLNNLGIMALREKDYDSARTLYEESVRLWKTLGNDGAIALALANLGNVSDLVADYEAAKDYYQRSLEFFERGNDRRGVALSLHHLGDIARHQDNPEVARSFYDRTLQLLMELGDKRGVANLLSDIGTLSAERGDYDEARHFYEESMVIFSGLGDVRGIANLFDVYAHLSAERGSFERALRLAAAGRAFRQEFAAPLSPEDAARQQEFVKSIQESLDEARAQRAWTEGQSMSAEKAIQYALAGDNG